MIGCLHVCKQPIIALYFELEKELKFYNLEAWSQTPKTVTAFLVLKLNYFHFRYQETDVLPDIVKSHLEKVPVVLEHVLQDTQQLPVSRQNHR